MAWWLLLNIWLQVYLQRAYQRQLCLPSYYRQHKFSDLICIPAIIILCLMFVGMELVAIMYIVHHHFLYCCTLKLTLSLQRVQCRSIAAHCAVVTNAIFAPRPELIIRSQFEYVDDEEHDLLAGVRGEVLVSADYAGLIRVFINKFKPGSGWPVAAREAWKSLGIWKWSGKSEEKRQLSGQFFLVCGVLPPVVQETQDKLRL